MQLASSCILIGLLEKTSFFEDTSSLVVHYIELDLNKIVYPLSILSSISFASLNSAYNCQYQYSPPTGDWSERKQLFIIAHMQRSQLVLDGCTVVWSSDFSYFTFKYIHIILVYVCVHTKNNSMDPVK